MPGPLYRTDPPEARRVQRLDSLWAIYHRASGITHIVSDPVPQILDVLHEGAGDAAEVVRRLSARHRLEDADAERIVTARLEEMEVAGLVFSA